MLASNLSPDVVLMDLNLPNMSGIEATRHIREHYPQIAILVVTMFDDDSVFAAMRAGARGYLLKGAEADETVRAICAVAHGEAIFSPSIASRLIGFFAAPHPPTRMGLFPELTDREREILHLLATGANNSEIARHLGLSLKTISNYVSSIFSKLQVADRAGAIIRARDAGFGTH